MLVNPSLRYMVITMGQCSPQAGGPTIAACVCGCVVKKGIELDGSIVIFVTM